MKFFPLAVISILLLFILSCSSSAYALPPSPWTGPNLTYEEAKVLSYKADNGYDLLQPLKKGAEQGNTNAMVGLMLYYQHSHQFKKAFFWAEKGAHANNSRSESYLGFAYYKGHGVQKNLKKALYWIGKSAKQHEYSSEYFLGYAHQYGKCGFLKNIQAAIPLYEAAAKDGAPAAGFTLSKIYRNGDGVQKNEKRAQYWENFTSKNSLLNEKEYQKAHIAFEKYERYGDPIVSKKENELALQGNSLFRNFMSMVYGIICVLLLFQVRKSWKVPEGSSAIFWGATGLVNILYCSGYFWSIMENVDSFMIWLGFIFYGAIAIMSGVITWSALFHRSKKAHSHGVPPCL